MMKRSVKRSYLAAVMSLTVLVVAAAQSAKRIQLTERLSQHSDEMEGVVGAREAEALVDDTLHRYENKQTAAKRAAKNAEKESVTLFKLSDAAERAAAEQEAETRHLKTKLAIILDQEANDSKVAEKAEGIAKRMAMLASKAEAQLHAVQEKENETKDRLHTVESQAQLSKANEKLQQRKQEEAELQAKDTSAKLAKLDMKITKLLDRRSRLKDIAAAEDKRTSTSLVEAFKEDADRQAKFREALAKQREAEERHHKQMALLRLERKNSLQTASVRRGADMHISSGKRFSPHDKAADSNALRMDGSEAADDQKGDQGSQSNGRRSSPEISRSHGGEVSSSRWPRSQLVSSSHQWGDDQDRGGGGGGGELGQRLERLLRSERAGGWHRGAQQQRERASEENLRRAGHGERVSADEGERRSADVERSTDVDGEERARSSFAEGDGVKDAQGGVDDFVIHASPLGRSAADNTR